jgi:chorismate mutase
MRRLRQQVDRIDLKMLQLLQQRTKLSGQIGKMKRRHGAVIYVPERERELVARLTRLSKGLPPARAVAALYREILSSSRAAQGQAPIGLLQASASLVLPASRACFGACDRFSPKKTWAELVKSLDTGTLSLALLTGDDLARALQTHRWRSEFFKRLTVAGDFFPVSDSKAPLARRIFIVTPRENGAAMEANRILILIECKSTLNAIKSLLHSMSDFSIHAELLTRRASVRQGLVPALARLTLAKPADGIRATSRLLAACKSVGIPVSILGIYPGTEDYGG